MWKRAVSNIWPHLRITDTCTSRALENIQMCVASAAAAASGCFYLQHYTIYMFSFVNRLFYFILLLMKYVREIFNCIEYITNIVIRQQKSEKKILNRFLLLSKAL